MNDGTPEKNVLRALVMAFGYRTICLAVVGDHPNLVPFASEAEGGDWESVQIVYEDEPPAPPGPGLWVMEWPWRELTAAEEPARDLCCIYIGEPSWRPIDVANLMKNP